MRTKWMVLCALFVGAISHAAMAQTMTVRIPISEFGWPKTNGDRDMDTDGGDIVPASCTSNLFFTSNRLMLDLFFYCAETGGDQTRFEGKRQLTLFTPPAGKRITAVSFGPGGSRLSTIFAFHGFTKGKAHYMQKFRTDIAGSYWESLLYRVDQNNTSNDGPYVGVKGTIKLTVVLADL